MPDFAACSNEECTRKDTCCRYLMVWGMMQTVAVIKGTAEDCDLHWPTKAGAPFSLRCAACGYKFGMDEVCDRCGAAYPGEEPADET